MSLPKLEVPTYEIVVPSSRKKIKYRPFLVKEYKILLTAIESSADEVSRIVTELVDVCTFNTLDVQNLSHFDLEYMFLNIRAKSIGENVSLTKECTSCNSRVDFSLNIVDMKLDREVPKDNKIILSDNLGVILRYPRFLEVLKLYDNLNSDAVIDLLSDCIETVFTKDEYFKKDSFTREDALDFILNLTKEQFDKLENFLTEMPKLVHEASLVCSNCGTTNHVKLEGLQNFFV